MINRHNYHLQGATLELRVLEVWILEEQIQTRCNQAREKKVSSSSRHGLFKLILEEEDRQEGHQIVALKMHYAAFLTAYKQT